MEKKKGPEKEKNTAERPAGANAAPKKAASALKVDDLENGKKQVERSTFLTYLMDKVKSGELNPLKTNMNDIQRQYADFEDKKKRKLEKYIAYEAVIGGARASIEFYVLLILSCFIALFGLYQNSPAVIIGAMIVAPLMGPVLGVSAGVMWGSSRSVLEALFTLFKGVVIVLLITATLTLLIPSVEITAEMDARSHPGLFDVAVALSCGFVGAYAFANRRISSALPGVAISVALMPPLCTVGIGIGLRHMPLVSGALLLFAINLIGISLAGAIVFYLVKLSPQSDTEHEGEIKKRAAIQLFVSIVMIALICAPLGVFAIRGYRNNALKKNVERQIETLVPPSAVFQSQIKIADDASVVLVLYEADAELMQRLRSGLRGQLGANASIRIYTLCGENATKE